MPLSNGLFGKHHDFNLPQPARFFVVVVSFVFFCEQFGLDTTVLKPFFLCFVAKFRAMFKTHHQASSNESIPSAGGAILFYCSF